MSYHFVQAANDYGRRKGPVLAFVIHMAEGGGTVGFLSRPNQRGVSVTYVIEYSGRIVQMLLESHASGSINPGDLRTTEGPSPFGISVAIDTLGSWINDPNSAVLSVEIEGFAKDGPNEDQKAALLRLVGDIRTRYPQIGLLGHRDFVDYKACPGSHIPWDALGGHGPATEEDMALVKFTPRLPLVGGTVTVNAGGAEVITLDGGARPTVSAGITRPAVGIVTLDDLDNRPCYLMLVGEEWSYIPEASVTFVKNDGPNAPAVDCIDKVEAAITTDRAKARIVYQ
jgi:hypothetical protein